MCPDGGVDAGQRPFSMPKSRFDRLSQSDKKCVCLQMFPQVRHYKSREKVTARGGADENDEMPDVRRAHEAQRQDGRGDTEMALQGLRGERRPRQRHDGEGPRRLSPVVARQVVAAGHARPGPELPQARVPLLAHLAHAGRGGRGAPRRVRRRDIPRQGRRRARRLQRRPRALLVPRQSRDVEGLEGAALQDSAAGHGGNGRRQRVRQGRSRALARDQGPEVSVPRVLPGEEVYDEPPEAAGGQGAVRPCAGSDGRRRPPPGGALGGEVRGMVRLLGRPPRGEERGRRPHGVHPRETQEGAARPELAAVKRAALRVPRPGPGARGPPPEDQQQDRGRGELAAEGGPQEPQGAEPGAEGKGGLLVVLHAHRVPAPCRRDSRSMPTDADIDLLYELHSRDPKGHDGPAWGDRPVWQEFHHQTSYPYYLD